jgi:hypothetical protein
MLVVRELMIKILCETRLIKYLSFPRKKPFLHTSCPKTTNTAPTRRKNVAPHRGHSAPATSSRHHKVSAHRTSAPARHEYSTSALAPYTKDRATNKPERTGKTSSTTPMPGPDNQGQRPPHYQGHLNLVSHLPPLFPYYYRSICLSVSILQWNTLIKTILVYIFSHHPIEWAIGLVASKSC